MMTRHLAAIAVASLLCLSATGASAAVFPPATAWGVYETGTTAVAPSTDPFAPSGEQMVTYTEGAYTPTGSSAPGMFSPTGVASTGTVMTIDMDVLGAPGIFNVLLGFDDVNCGCFEASSLAVSATGGWQQFKIATDPVNPGDYSLPGFEAFGQASGGSQVSFDLVPEPATWTMTLVGFLGLGAMLRRRRLAIAP
jgi:hypothetical protein